MALHDVFTVLIHSFSVSGFILVRVAVVLKDYFVYILVVEPTKFVKKNITNKNSNCRSGQERSMGME